MSDEQAVLTASFKGDGGFDAPLLVVRAETPHDMLQRLDALASTGILAKVAQIAREMHGVYAADQGLQPSATVVVPDPAYPQPPISQPQVQQAAYPQAPPQIVPGPDVNNNGWGAAQPQPGYQAQAAGGYQPAPVPQQQPGAPFTETDRYGNTFVYNDPAAPMCARGPMVKATRMKRDNSGTYTMWLDPAHKACPLWKKQGNPPVDPSQLAPDQWLNKR